MSSQGFEDPKGSGKRKPIAEVLPDIQLHPLESEAGEATDVFLLIRQVDVDGHVSWSYRTSKSPNREELLGALMIQVDLLRRDLRDEWVE